MMRTMRSKIWKRRHHLRTLTLPYFTRKLHNQVLRLKLKYWTSSGEHMSDVKPRTPYWSTYSRTHNVCGGIPLQIWNSQEHTARIIILQPVSLVDENGGGGHSRRPGLRQETMYIENFNPTKKMRRVGRYVTLLVICYNLTRMRWRPEIVNETYIRVLAACGKKNSNVLRQL